MSTRSRVKSGLAAAFALTALTVSGAHAQNVQNFKPAQGTWNYFSVEGARTAKHLEFVPRLYLNYASRPLIERNKDGDVIRELVGKLGTANIMMDLGVADLFEIGLDVPIHYVDGVTTADEDNSGVAIGDVRIMPKIRIFGLAPSSDQYGFGLALAVPVTVPTGDADKFVGDDQLTVEPKLILEGRVPGFSIAANAGARIRPETSQVQTLEVGNELTYGLGLGVDLGSPDAVLIAEGFGVAPLDDVNSQSRSKPLEALLGFRFFTGAGAVFDLGAGAGIIDDYGSPEFRIIGGFAWHDRTNDRDQDGILDDVDQCPDDPEDKDGFEDENGCPDPDNDGDGVLDTSDQCPMDPEDNDGFEDENGCPDPDNDQDKLLDSADQCPNEPENYNEYKDEDGCPDEIPDTDGDGLIDTVDKCPNDPEDKDGFEDEDGCPDPDNDKDGILDGADACPNQAEVINGVKDEDGCPDEGVSKVKVTTEKIEILEKVYFATNRARILRKSFPVLNQVASVLNNYKTIKKVRVEGHTDSTGKDAYNKKLSQMRADSVMQFLIKRGIDASRLEAVGYGEEKPIDSNKTKAGKANNRRVEFTIIEQEGSEVKAE